MNAIQLKPTICILYLSLGCAIEARQLDLAALIPAERQAAERGAQLGIGTIRLDGPKEVEVYSYQTFKLVYTAGQAGIKPGGTILVGMRHILGWTTAQTKDPQADGYLTAVTSNQAPVSLYVEQNRWVKDSKYTWRLFPWQNIIACQVGEPGLKPGDRVVLVLGDRRAGSKGVRIQPVDEFPFVFKCYVDFDGSENCLPLRENPTIDIVSAPPYRLNLVMPSYAQTGKPTWCIVRAEDRYGNPATRYRGTVQINSPKNDAPVATYTFQAADQGVHRFENIRFSKPGLFTLAVCDGTFSCNGNPVQVKTQAPPQNLYWGDLHGHTLFSDGRGTVEQFYDFAENVAGLDFCAVTDHGFEITDAMWAYSKEVTNRVYRPGKFVTFQAYEWSGIEQVGGDHNVFFLGDDPPLYRSRSYYNYQNYQMYHGPQAQINHVEDLFRVLAQDIKNREVFCIPHWGGRRGNPAWHHGQVQRAIEVFSEHRRSEDWISTFLTKGHRLGIMASTDGHLGNPGYGYLKLTQPMNWDTQEIGMAALAVYAEELTRKAIFKALYQRRTYATSGERILLDFKVNEAPMGSEITAHGAPILWLQVAGTKSIKTIHLKKNSKIAKTFQPKQNAIELSWRDDNFQGDTPCYYYVHIVQADGEEAMSSPVWVN